MGNWRLEHLFTLSQSRELYRTYQQRIVDCDLEVEKLLPRFEARVDPSGETSAARSETESGRTKKKEEERASQSRSRSAYGSL